MNNCYISWSLTMKKLVLLLILICAASYGHASDWHVISQDDEMTYFVDKQSITRSGKYRKAWAMASYAQQQKLKDYEKTPHQSVKALNYYICSDRTGGQTQMSLYSEPYGQGAHVKNYVVELRGASFTEVIPDTIGEMALNYVCSYPLKSDKPAARKRNTM